MLKNDANLTNVRSGSVERLSHIGCLFGKTIQPVTELHAGDIGAVAKLKDTFTGDTLAEKGSLISYPPVKLAEPSIAFAIEAKTRQDEDRMGAALQRILEEDQSLRFYRDPQTKEFLLAGSGQQHVEVIVSRLKNRYSVDVTLKAPKVPYRETIRGTADVQGRHKKQTGGHGQFGDCWIKMEPLPRGGGLRVRQRHLRRLHSPELHPGRREGHRGDRRARAIWPAARWSTSGSRSTTAPTTTSTPPNSSFKLAARKAFKAAMQQAKPRLLEPIMTVEVQAPVEYAGDLMGDINGRRGRISGMDTKGNTQIVRAQVPMAEMLNYQNDLISMTQGRAYLHHGVRPLRLRAAACRPRRSSPPPRPPRKASRRRRSRRHSAPEPMRRKLLVGLFSFLILASSLSAADSRAVADAAFDELIRQDFASLAKRFTPEMSAALPLEKLAAVGPMLKQLGALPSGRPAPQVTAVQGMDVFVFPCDFSTAKMNVVITVNSGGTSIRPASHASDPRNRRSRAS